MKRKIKVLWIFIFLICITLFPCIIQAEDTAKQITMDFNDVDIRVFIKFISELTGKILLLIIKLKAR